MKEKFICGFCGKEFNTVQALSGHSGNCKDNPKNKDQIFECQYCHRTDFTSKNGFKFHENHCSQRLDYVKIHIVKPKTACQYCGKLIENANLKRHEEACCNPESKLNRKKYHIKDYNDDLTCRYCGKQYKDAGNLVKHETQECLLNPDITDEMREQRHQNYLARYENMSEEAKDRMKWNKGKTKEDDPRIANFADTLISGYASGSIIPAYLGKQHTKEEKLKIGQSVSTSRKAGYANGTITPAEGIGRGKYSYIIYGDKTYMLRSTYEFIYALYLIDQNIEFGLEKIRVQAAYENDFGNTFIADFNIGNQIIEIKGVKSLKDQVIKDSFEFAGYEFKELFSEDIKIIKAQLSKTYPIDDLLQQIRDGHDTRNYFHYVINKEA